MSWFVVPASAGRRRKAFRLKVGLQTIGCAISLAFAGNAAEAAAAELRVVGTDLLGLEFTKALYEFAGHEGLRLTVAFDGSRPGLEQLRAGRADLGLFVLPPEDARALSGFETQPIGYHAVVVSAPEGCPLDQITFDQLAAVFGARPATTNNPGVRWRDLGAGGEWAGEFVTPLAPEVGTGIAIEYFRHVVLRDAPFGRDLLRFASGPELAMHVRSHPRALIVSGGWPRDATGLKRLKVAVAADQPGILPTAETLYAGSYPLRLPVELVFPTERLTEAVRILRFLHGDTATGLLEKAGVAPLPASARTVRPSDSRAKKKPLN